MASDDPLIPLKDGPALRQSVIAWMLRAEDRGLQLTVASDDLLQLGPRRLVTDEDLTFAKAHKYDLDCRREVHRRDVPAAAVTGRRSPMYASDSVTELLKALVAARQRFQPVVKEHTATIGAARTYHYADLRRPSRRSCRPCS